MLLMKKRTDQAGKEGKAEETSMRVDSIAGKDTCILQTLGTVNTLLQYMTELDYVKDMIRDADEQAELLAVVAGNSEEMAAATADIARFVQESNAVMEKTVAETNQNLHSIDATFETIGENIGQTSGIQDTIQSVRDEAEKINNLVNLIKSVSDQTKILSINASIEAARAGTHGRGFAVVASEIKTLAQNTRTQVDVINGIIENLNAKVAKASAEIDQMTRQFDACKQSIQSSASGIKEITTAVGAVNDSFVSISSSVQEQSAATQQISANIQTISQKAAKLQKETHRTGQAFFEISQQVDEIRLRALRCTDDMDPATMLELAVTDHLMWKWRVYNMLLGYIRLQASEAGNHDECRLGRWLPTLNQQDAGIRSIVAKLSGPHEQIHKLAAQAIAEYERHNHKGAEQKLEEIERNSHVVVHCLRELKKLL